MSGYADMSQSHAVICVACHQRSFREMRLVLALVQEVWRQAGEAQNLSQLAEVIPNPFCSESLPLVSKATFYTT